MEIWPSIRGSGAPTGHLRSECRHGPRVVRLRQRVALLVAAALVVVVVLAVRGGGKAAPALQDGAMRAGLGGDALAWDPERSRDYAARAAGGLAHVLYAKSPGGMLASARAVA